MHAPVRPSSLLTNNNNPQASCEALNSSASSTTPDIARVSNITTRRPHPSIPVATIGRIPAASTRQRQPQLAARPPVSWQRPAPPAPASPLKGTAMLAVRGSGHGVGGECMRGGHNNPTNDGGFKLSVGISAAGAASTAAASGRQGQHVARAVGRGAPSMLPGNAGRRGQERVAANMRQQPERLRAQPQQESISSEPSTHSSGPLSQAPSSVSGARQPPRDKPAKPPRPPGPPPAHILLEQKRSRDMLALQVAQQLGSASEGGPGRIEARQRPNDTPTPGHAQNIPQCINPPRDGTSTVRRGADHRADSLRQGGASILGIETGNKSFAVNGSQRYRGGLTAGAYPDEAAGFAKAGGLPVRAGVATVNSSSASGPLRLTCSRSATEVAVAVEKNGASEWQEFWDDEVEASYYFNCTTREAQWVRPDGL